MTKPNTAAPAIQLQIRGRRKQKPCSNGETGSPGEETGCPPHNTRPCRSKSEILLDLLRLSPAAGQVSSRGEPHLLPIPPTEKVTLIRFGKYRGPPVKMWMVYFHPPLPHARETLSISSIIPSRALLTRVYKPGNLRSIGDLDHNTAKLNMATDAHNFFKRKILTYKQLRCTSGTFLE